MKDCIKCKDCKFFNAWRTLEDAEKHGQIYECSKLVLSSPSPDDYCSKAEKKEEQESILDKIRAEIEQITDTMGVSYNQYVSKIDVLQIIDKYRG